LCFEDADGSAYETLTIVIMDAGSYSSTRELTVCLGKRTVVHRRLTALLWATLTAVLRGLAAVSRGGLPLFLGRRQVSWDLDNDS
jgi:hypothetical protein